MNEIVYCPIGNTGCHSNCVLQDDGECLIAKALKQFGRDKEEEVRQRYRDAIRERKNEAYAKKCGLIAKAVRECIAKGVAPTSYEVVRILRFTFSQETLEWANPSTVYGICKSDRSPFELHGHMGLDSVITIKAAQEMEG